MIMNGRGGSNLSAAARRLSCLFNLFNVFLKYCVSPAASPSHAIPPAVITSHTSRHASAPPTTAAQSLSPHPPSLLLLRHTIICTCQGPPPHPDLQLTTPHYRHIPATTGLSHHALKHFPCPRAQHTHGNIRNTRQHSILLFAMCLSKPKLHEPVYNMGLI